MPTEQRATNIVKVVEYASSADTERRATNVVKMVEYASSASSATWSAPAHLDTGDFISAATWNTYVVNNLLWLGTSHNHDGDAGDGASITTPVPSGAIGIFDTSCPGGWTQVAAWDGRYLKGAASYGGTGGTSGHSHASKLDATITGVTLSNDHMVFWPISQEGRTPSEYTFCGGPNTGSYTAMKAQTGTATTNADPPNIQVIFCKKV